MIKDLFLYSNTKAQFATDKNLKKQNFKDAIDQIEAALRGEDPAPREVYTPISLESNGISTVGQLISLKFLIAAAGCGYHI